MQIYKTTTFGPVSFKTWIGASDGMFAMQKTFTGRIAGTFCAYRNIRESIAHTYINRPSRRTVSCEITVAR